MSNIVPQIISKYLEDREKIKAIKAKHAEELRVLEEFQSKREAALLDLAGIESFGFMTDLYINGRDGKASKEKEKEDISLNQSKLEAWLIKHLNQVGDSIKTAFGTAYLTRRESVSVADFDAFITHNMLPDAADAVISKLELETGEICTIPKAEIIEVLRSHMHLELLNKSVNKSAVLERMGDTGKDGSRPHTPPVGINYVATRVVGVRKA